MRTKVIVVLKSFIGYHTDLFTSLFTSLIYQQIILDNGYLHHLLGINWYDEKQ